jgi:cytochrome c-type biogenesis protein CcmH/NrfG
MMPAAAPAPDRASRWVPLCLALVIVAVYWNGSQMGFHFDDGHVIEQNPHIRSLTNVPRFFVDPATSSASQLNRVVRPLLLATFAVNYAISGNAPWSYHLVNLLLHWLAVVLVFRIVRDHLWLGEAATAVAAAAALVVAVHPLNTSAVNYVSARSALLTAVFYLGAFDVALRGRLVASTGLYVLALLTKEIAVTLPLLILGYWGIARARADGVRTPVRWVFLGVLAALGVASLAWRAVLMSPSLIAAVHGTEADRGVYFMTEWSAYLYYLRLFLWPDALVIDRVDYPLTRSLGEVRGWGSLLVLVLIGSVGWALRRRGPAVSVVILWYFVALAAESTVFPLAEPVNEHRPYLAMLGLGTATALALWHVGAVLACRLHAPVVWAFAVCVTFVTTGLGAAAIGRNQTWRDDYTLWRDATQKAPRNPRAWLNAGHAAMVRGDNDEARRFLLEAHRLAPCYAYVQMNLSALAARTGDLAGSLRWAEEGVACNPGMALTHFYRAAALERMGRTDEALEAYGKTAATEPYHVDAWLGQGRLLEAREEWPAAAAAYDRALGVDPGRTEAAMGAGVIYHYRLGDPARALERYRAALRAVPTHYGAHYQTAVALLALGKEGEAVAAWQRFVPLARAIGDERTLDAAPATLRGATVPNRPS